MDTGGIHWVRISHVEDPDLIYVQHLDIVGYEGELLETLKAEFEELIPDWHAEELNRSPNSCIVGELYVYKYVRTNNCAIITMKWKIKFLWRWFSKFHEIYLNIFYYIGLQTTAKCTE